MENILVCDDDREIVEAISIYLEEEGYQVYKAYDGIDGFEILKTRNIHLAIIDVMMPRIDGIRLVKELRKYWSIPVIFLSAKSEDSDKILGLKIGADDYITKPFNPLELIARVKSNLRRYMTLGSSPVKQDVYTAGGLMVDDTAKRCFVYGEYIMLTPIEYNILLFLIKNKGQVFSIKQIYQNVWHSDVDKPENTLAVHISHIRDKIEVNPREPLFIKVVRGMGYKVEDKSYEYSFRF